MLVAPFYWCIILPIGLAFTLLQWVINLFYFVPGFGGFIVLFLDVLLFVGSYFAVWSISSTLYQYKIFGLQVLKPIGDVVFKIQSGIRTVLGSLLKKALNYLRTAITDKLKNLVQEFGEDSKVYFMNYLQQLGQYIRDCVTGKLNNHMIEGLKNLGNENLKKLQKSDCEEWSEDKVHQKAISNIIVGGGETGRHILTCAEDIKVVGYLGQDHVIAGGYFESMSKDISIKIFYVGASNIDNGLKKPIASCNQSNEPTSLCILSDSRSVRLSFFLFVI